MPNLRRRDSDTSDKTPSPTILQPIPTPVPIPSPPSDNLLPNGPFADVAPPQPVSHSSSNETAINRPRPSMSNPRRISLQITAGGGISRLAEGSMDGSRKLVFTLASGSQPVTITAANTVVTVTPLNSGRASRVAPLFEESVALVGLKVRTNEGFVFTLRKRLKLRTTSNPPTGALSTREERRKRTRSAPPSRDGSATSFSSSLTSSRSKMNLKDSLLEDRGKQVKFQLITSNRTLDLVAKCQQDLDSLMEEIAVEKAFAMAGAEGGNGSRLLYSLRERDERNRRCRDCGESLPEWVVLEKLENGTGWMAMIVCEGCGGFHRGRDSSKVMVRSFLLDDKLFADPTTDVYRAIVNVANDMGLPKL
ncbi:hypothetical protein HK097_010085 [Rhizophlyctis rosea]|uniref:Arf-GAP domain-containing protein n=1 Tax=Rhizophlyctis rosea TaxID=64517 RepID=A0AAD5SHJ9_9FUNG|nr:hypothetical protein HK097_010085 [Rhizophlyctis rosea]